MTTASNNVISTQIITMFYVHCKTIQPLCCLEVQKPPNPVFSDFFFYLPTVIYSHPSHGSSTTQCSCLISDSVNPFPLRLMSHEFTLLTPLHRSLASRSPYLPQFLHHYYSKRQTHTGTQAEEETSVQKAFLSQQSISRAFSAESGIQQPPLQGLLTFCSLSIL